MAGFMTRSYDLVVSGEVYQPGWPLFPGGDGYFCSAHWWSTIAGQGGAFPENPIYIFNDSSARQCVVAHAANGAGGDWSGDSFTPAGDPGNLQGWYTGAPCPVMTPNYSVTGGTRSAGVHWESRTGGVGSTANFLVQAWASRNWLRLSTGPGDLIFGNALVNNGWFRMVDAAVAAGDAGASTLLDDTLTWGQPSGPIQWAATAVAGRVTNTGANPLVVGSSLANFGTSWPRGAASTMATTVAPGTTSPWIPVAVGDVIRSPSSQDLTPWGSLDVTSPYADPGWDPGPTSGDLGTSYTIQWRISTLRTSTTPAPQTAPPLAARGRLGNLDANAHAARATRTSQGLLTARGML